MRPLYLFVPKFCFDYMKSDLAAVPKDYDDLLSYYTKHGYRVIAIAGKSIDNLSWLKAQRMKRFAPFLVATVIVP